MTTEAYVPGVKSKPVESVPHESTPAVLAFTSQDALFSPETTSALDEALPVTERFVVVALPPVMFVKVTSPVLETEKSVEVAKAAVEDEMTKSVWFVYIEALELAAKMENVA